jgi:23S rRNA (adenine2503-C2)-methyltransferase
VALKEDARADILGMTWAELRAASDALPSGKGAAPAVYSRALREGRALPDGSVDASRLGLSLESEAAWVSGFRVGLLEVLEVVDEPGETGTTSKAILAAADGRRVECVRIPMPGGDGSKATLCVSSQAGCRMGCAFCETGARGFFRDLSAAEIVSQVVTAGSRLGWSCGNVVFMGMGECLDNFEEVARALAILNEPRGLGYSWERLTVCTCGPPGGVERLRGLGHKRLNLSISLNAATDASRSAIMPVNRRNGLEALASSLAAYPQRRNFALGVNWCLMPGVNDAREDAAGAAAFCRRVGRCVVNLIPYNPGSSPISGAPSEEDLGRFASWLEEEGCIVKRRASKGGSIMAGCGQLAGR